MRDPISKTLKGEKPLASACTHMNTCACTLMHTCALSFSLFLFTGNSPMACCNGTSRKRTWTLGSPRKQCKCKGVLLEEFGSGRSLVFSSDPLTRHNMVPAERQAGLRQPGPQGAACAGLRCMHSSLPQFLPPRNENKNLRDCLPVELRLEIT